MLLRSIEGFTPLTANAIEGVAPSEAPRADLPQAVAATEAAAATAEDVRAAVTHANETIQAFTQALEFEIDPDTKKIVIRLVDTQDQRVLRQIPSDEMLAIARALDRMQTLLVRGQA
jgi:flagellar protein FlaG